MSGIGTQPLAYLTELPDHSAAIVARPAEARLDGYVSNQSLDFGVSGPLYLGLDIIQQKVTTFFATKPLLKETP